MSTLDFYRAVLIIGMMFAFVFSIPIAYLIYIQVGNYLSNKTTYLRFTKYPGVESESQKNYDAFDLEYSTESEPSNNHLSNARIRSQEMPSENVPNIIRFNRSTPPSTIIIGSPIQSLSKVKGVHLYRARIRNTRAKPSPWKNCLAMCRASDKDSNLYHAKEI